MAAWIGMSISIAGLQQLPKCHHGKPDCFFYVQVIECLHEMCIWVHRKEKVGPKLTTFFLSSTVTWSNEIAEPNGLQKGGGDDVETSQWSHAEEIPISFLQ